MGGKFFRGRDLSRYVLKFGGLREVLSDLFFYGPKFQRPLFDLFGKDFLEDFQNLFGGLWGGRL